MKRYIRNFQKNPIYPSVRIIYETDLVIGFELVFKDASFNIYFRKKIYPHLIAFIRNYQDRFNNDQYVKQFIDRFMQRARISIKEGIFEPDLLVYFNTRFLR